MSDGKGERQTRLAKFINFEVINAIHLLATHAF